MVKLLRMKMMLLLCALMAGSGSVWAQGSTVEYSVQGKGQLETKGTAPTGTSATIYQTYSNANQMTSGNSHTLTLTGYNGYKVTNIKLKMKSNASKGAGNLSYSTDGGTTYTYLVGSSNSGVNFSDDSWYGAWSSTAVEVSKKVEIEPTTSDFIIKIEATANSLYCYSYTLTYEPVVSKQDDAITVTGGTEFTIDRTQGEEELTLEATATSGRTVSFAVDTENTTVDAADYEFEGGLLLVSGTKSGVIVIKASVAEDDNYKAAEETITVNVVGVKEDAIISVEDKTLPYNTSYTLVADEDYLTDGVITLTSNSPAVTVDNTTLTITAAAVGTATITVNAAEGTDYKAAAGSFTVTVTAPEGKTTAATSAATLFNETFDLCEGSGGRDNVFTGSVGTSSTTGKLDESWATIGDNGAYHCIKLGSNSNAGSVTTSNISLTGNGTLTFSAAGWGDTKTNTISVSATGAELSGDTEVTLEASTWNNYTVNITGATGSVAITFTMKRGFLDDVVVFSEGSAITAKLNDSGFATFCSEYPLDFTNAEGYTAWQITSIDTDNKITFEQITGSVKGGTGIFLKGEAGQTVTLTSADSSNELGGNMLEGTLAPKYVGANEYYGLSGSSFVKVNAGTVPAGKALIDADWITESANGARFTFVFTESTGIETVKTTMGQGKVFDLQGRRVYTPGKGMYIVDGKKMIMK